MALYYILLLFYSEFHLRYYDIFKINNLKQVKLCVHID